MLWCYGAEATQEISYGPAKFGMPEKEADSRRTLADTSLDLCPARKSAWDFGLIVGSLSVLCLKGIVVVWYDPDLACVVSFFQPPFSQTDHIHVGCVHTSVSGSTTEFLCTGANPGYIPTPHQGETPLPPCPTFCTKVGQAHGQKLQHYPSGR